MTTETYTLRARRLAAMLPGRDVLEDGAVAVREGLVAEAGTWRELKSRCPAEVRDLGEVTLLPGLINAHTHLELSHLGLPPEPGRGFLDWVRWLVAQPVADVDEKSLDRAIDQLVACGAVAVADITSRHPLKVARGLAARGLDCLIQFERFGYQADAPLPGLEEIPEDRLALAGHALYSTSPESLRRAKAWDSARGRAFSIHLAEHTGEVELLASGTGEFADFMRGRILPGDFTPPGCSPVAWADALGLLDQRTLAVHAVHVSKTDIELLKRRGTFICLCPRSNAVIGVGRADAGAFLDAGLPCCLGTDSLSSVPDLNLWEELRALLNLPGVGGLSLARAALLLSANPARLFGFSRLGRFAPGCDPRYAVLPADLELSLGD
jgi:cytosine/adenosine deaminase-related metal-dependent hydrolase